MKKIKIESSDEDEEVDATTVFIESPINKLKVAKIKKNPAILVNNKNIVNKKD